MLTLFPYDPMAYRRFQEQRKSKESDKIQAFMLLDFMETNDLTNIITTPTTKNNILDLLFTNITNSLYDCTITKYLVLSDHNLIELKLTNATDTELSPSDHADNEDRDSNSQPNYSDYNFYKADYDSINKDLNSIKWPEVLDGKMLKNK